MTSNILALNASFKSSKLSFGDLHKTQACAIYYFVKKHKEKKGKQLDPTNVALGVVIRRRRMAMGLTLADLAWKLKCSEGQMSKKETGASIIKPNELPIIAEVLKTTPEALWGEIGKPLPDLDVALHGRIATLDTNGKKHLLDFLISSAKSERRA